jgi:hypothetical protein
MRSKLIVASFFLLFSIFLIQNSVVLSNQAGRNVPAVALKDLSGKNFNTSSIPNSNDGKPVVITF